MPKVCEVESYLEGRIPPALALDFDNVGLLCGFPDREIGRVLVALDITLDVIGEASQAGAELIVAHHPLIFTPMRHILSSEPEGRRVIALLQAGLSAICMHTNLDIVPGGVNTALAAALGAACVEEEGGLEIGRICELPEDAPLSDFLETARRALQASGLRFSDGGRPVRRIAVCGGAGGDLVEKAAQSGCDTVVTGEIKHHQWLSGRELGLNLVEAGHFPTENCVIPVLAGILRDGFPSLEVMISSRCAQPCRGMEI